MTVPGWWAALLMALGVFRLTRLVGWDDFPPIRNLRWRVLRTTVDRTVTTAGQVNGPTRYRHGRQTLGAFLECPYCVGFWIGLAAFLMWQVVPTATLVVLFPFALNAAVGTWARMLDP